MSDLAADSMQMVAQAGSFRSDADAFLRRLVKEKQGPNPDDAIPHYPSSRHVEKNLAPEHTLRYRDIAALANARRQAEETGVLDPKLAEYMLPMAMVEGRSGNFGILQDNRFYAHPRTLDRFRRMGLAMEGPMAPLAIKDIPGKGRHIGPSAKMEGNSDTYAKMMAAIMAEKAALVPAGNLDEAVKRYNGRGRAIEYVDDQPQQADVNTYLAKVKDALQMLSHPKNKPLFDHFNAVYQRKR